MFTRFISSILIVTSAFVIAFGQDKKDDGDRSPRTFAFTMDGGGSYLGVGIYSGCDSGGSQRQFPIGRAR